MLVVVYSLFLLNFAPPSINTSLQPIRCFCTQARMKDSLVSRLKFTKIRDYELAWVDASISLEGASGTSPSETDGAATHNRLVADRLPVLKPSDECVTETHKTVFVNEPKLSDVSGNCCYIGWYTLLRSSSSRQSMWSTLKQRLPSYRAC